MGGGRYSELSSVDPEAGLWRSEEGSEFNLRDDAMGDRWKDMGPWLVLLLLPIAVFGFRQGLLFMLVIGVAPLAMYSPAAQADWWDDLWQRKDQQAFEALHSDDAAKAAALAQDPELAGEAWYRASEFGNATESWMRASSDDIERNEASLSYNRGNALAHAGQLDAALEAYDEALALEPEFADAKYNRDIVEQMKQEQEQQQQDGESQEGESSDEQQQSEDSEQSQEEGEQDENSEQQEGEDESEAQGENPAAAGRADRLSGGLERGGCPGDGTVAQPDSRRPRRFAPAQVP